MSEERVNTMNAGLVSKKKGQLHQSDFVWLTYCYNMNVTKFDLPVMRSNKGFEYHSDIMRR